MFSSFSKVWAHWIEAETPNLSKIKLFEKSNLTARTAEVKIHTSI